MERAVLGSKTHGMRHSVAILLYGISFLLYFPPADYVVSDTIYSLWQYITLVSSALFVFMYLIRGKITRTYGLLMFYAAWIFIICSIIARSNAPFTKNVYNTFKMAGMISLTYFGISFNKKECLKGFIGAGLVMCTVNMISVYLFSNQIGGMKHGMLTFFGGLTTNQFYFLGLDNFFFTYYLSLLTVMFYYSLTYKDSRMGRLAFVYSLLSFLMFLYLQSVTAFMSMGIFIAATLYISAKSNKVLRLPNVYIIVLIGVVVNLFIIISHNIPLFDFINQFINKASSFAGRYSMWGNAEALIATSPIVGNGVNDTWTIVYSIGLDHVHNIILQILYQGGLIGFVLYLLALVATFFKKRLGLIVGTDKASAVLLLCILLYFLNGAMDYYIWEVTQYFVIVLAALSMYGVQQAKNPMGAIYKRGRCR